MRRRPLTRCDPSSVTPNRTTASASMPWTRWRCFCVKSRFTDRCLTHTYTHTHTHTYTDLLLTFVNLFNSFSTSLPAIIPGWSPSNNLQWHRNDDTDTFNWYQTQPWLWI